MHVCPDAYPHPGSPVDVRGPGPSAAAVSPGPAPSKNQSGGQDLVKQRLGLVLVGLLRERQLADQDLPRLGEHSLLACREPALAVPAPQVADDLGYLVDVTRGQLLQ